MADINSTIFRKAGTGAVDLVDSNLKGGRVRPATAHLVVTGAGVDINDKGFVVTLPSNCRLLPESTIYHDALGAGAADVDFGDINDPDGLADGLDMTLAGSKSALAAILIEEYGMRLWEMLGYTSDPYRDLDLYVTFKAEPAVDGDLVVDLRYVIE